MQNYTVERKDSLEKVCRKKEDGKKCSYSKVIFSLHLAFIYLSLLWWSQGLRGMVEDEGEKGARVDATYKSHINCIFSDVY